MAKWDNFFALLDDDDEGVDLMTLVARVEAKAAAPRAVAAAASDGVAAKLSQRASADNGKMVRERGRRGHYKRGHGDPPFEEADGDGVEGQSTDGFTKVYHGDSAARGRRGSGRRGGSRDRGRGGSRGRGRVERTFGNASHSYNTDNHGQNGDVNEHVTEEPTKGYEYRSDRPSRYEIADGKIGDENQNSGFKENHGFRSVERRNFSGENRSVMVGQGYGGNRGFRGGEYRDENGYQREIKGFGNVNRRFTSEAQMYARHNEAQDGGGEVKKNENVEEVKDDAAARTDQGANNANNGENGSGWNMPEVTEAVTDGKTESRNLEKKKTEDEEDRRKRMEAEEEEKKMTLIEYEKLLQEKRKALEAMRNEAKRVVDEKEFEGMQLVEKKKEEELFVKLKMDKEKQKKKEGIEREEKARKSSVSINIEYYGGRGRARGRGQHGAYRGGHRPPGAPAIEDPSQFPILGQAVKA